MGHELAGEVVSTGPEVKNVKPGDRVVIETVLGDDTCERCNIQQYNLCPDLYKVRMQTVSQTFAQYVIPSASYSFWDIYPEMKICLDLLSKEQLNAKKMISHNFPIEQINDAFKVTRDKEHSDALFVALTIT